MPLCTNCGSHDVEEVDIGEFACLNCDATFLYDGEEPEDQAIMPEGDSLDMQAWEDRINPIGDE